MNQHFSTTIQTYPGPQSLLNAIALCEDRSRASDEEIG